MVGVPGKFAGCNTCRDRRVKCDNERPKCKKCINSGRECGGYERSRVFIVSTHEEQGRCSSHPHRSISLHAARERRPSQSIKRSKAVYQRPQALGPVDHVPYAHANQLQLLALYANVLSLEPFQESQDGPSILPSLLDYLPDLARRSPALESALRALCLIHIGVTKKDEHLVKESILLNTQAMSKVRLATINERTATNIETLVASMCLYLYEKVACTVEKAGAWRILFRGSSLLVKARGPASYKCYPDHHFFVKIFRNEAVFDAMSLRKATFLAEREWRTVPWENIPKTDTDRLIDIQVFLPRIFELGEQLEKWPPSPNRTAKAKVLLQKCMQFDQMFDNWYATLQNKSSEPLIWSSGGNITRRKNAQNLGFDLCCVYTTYLEFPDLRTAFLHLYYWAGLTLFYRTMQKIHQLCYDDPSVQTSTSPESFTSAHHHSSIIPAGGLHPHPLPPPSPPVLQPCQFHSTLLSQLFLPHDSTANPFPLHNNDNDNDNETNAAYPFPPTLSPPSSYAPTTSSPAHSLLSDHTPTVPTVPPLDPKYSATAQIDMAHNICRSLPYALDRTLHDLGPDHSAWPIWCALQVFKRQGYAEQTTWCTEMMEMWGREGWKFATQIGRVDWMDYRTGGS